MASAYPAAVFVIVPIDNVMTAVLDASVATVGSQHPLRFGLFGSTAGDAIGDLTGGFSGFFIDGIQQRDGGFDFVGAFELLVGCGQATYFFGV